MAVGPATSTSSTAVGSLEPQGPVAEVIADLWWLMLWLDAAVFVVFAALLVLALVRRWTPDPDPRAQRKLVGR